jgi:hypothetical protein
MQVSRSNALAAVLTLIAVQIKLQDNYAPLHHITQSCYTTKCITYIDTVCDNVSDSPSHLSLSSSEYTLAAKSSVHNVKGQ